MFRPEAQALLEKVQQTAPEIDLRTDLTVLLVGSQAQNLADEHSDHDHMLIYAPLAELGVPFSPLPEQLHSDDRSQRSYRIDKYARMLEGGNADVVLSCWSEPELQGTGEGAQLTQRLRQEIRPYLINQQYVASCAAHFASTCNDIEKRGWVRGDILENPAEAARIARMGSRSRLDDKVLMHGLRMGYHALHAEQTGERLSSFDRDRREQLLLMKRHELPWQETLQIIVSLRDQLLYLSKDPEKPWKYDASRAAHLGRSERMRTVIRDIFRDGLRR